MRLGEARVKPVEQTDWSPEQQELMAPLVRRGVALNIFKTMAGYPASFRAFMVWARYILGTSALPVREREIAILRTGYLCRAGYEWAQHVPIGKRAGLTDEEIEAIKRETTARAWSPADEAILKAADELHRDQFVSSSTWAAVCEHFDENQRLDLVYTIAQYTQVSMILNTFGVQLEDGLTLDPDLDGR